MSNLFELDPLAAKNSMEWASLNPATFEAIDALVFEDNLKLALWVGGAVIGVMVLGAAVASRKGVRLWPLTGVLVSLYVLASAGGIWASIQKNEYAQISLREASAKARAAYKPEPFNFQSMPLQLPQMPIKALSSLPMPQPPREITIEMNCSSIGPGVATCSGTSSR
jgi:hypothetical protein